MILEENSQDQSSRPYYRSVTSEMCALQPKILNRIECRVQNNALNSRKCPKDITTWGTTSRYGQCQEYIDEALSIAMHAMRAAIHSTLGSSHWSLTFNRDMFFNIPLIADWHIVTHGRERLINEDLMRENQKHCRYSYVPQQRVLKKKGKIGKIYTFLTCGQ